MLSPRLSTLPATFQRRARLSKKQRKIFSVDSRTSHRALLRRQIHMLFWVPPMQVWAKRPLLSPKAKKPWPCIPLPSIHGAAQSWRSEWQQIYARLGDADHAIPILKRLLQLPIGFGLRRRCCGSIRSGTRSATIRVSKNSRGKAGLNSTAFRGVKTAQFAQIVAAAVAIRSSNSCGARRVARTGSRVGFRAAAKATAISAFSA